MSDYPGQGRDADEPPPEADELPPDLDYLPPADIAAAAHRPSSEQAAAPNVVAGSRSPSPGAEERSEPVPPADSEALARDARAILRVLTGNQTAEFHPGQLEAILALVADRSRALVVQRTGWGKSAVYFIAALLQRRAGRGPALIVSPLLALMRDQVNAARQAGIRAAMINSSNATEWGEVEEQLEADTVDVLLVSPERLVNPRFQESQLPRLVANCGLLVIDEAHCISDWGHDFRPDYRRIRDLIARLPAGVPVLATTATANSRVVRDVAEQLAAGEHEVFTLRGPLARDSLRLGVLQLETPTRRLAWLAQHLGELPGSGIVYCLTVSAAEDAAAALAKAGHDVVAYTGRTDAAERLTAETALKQNSVKALIATSALGMGFDKPDLGFVVHLGAPSSPVAYYQQVGRAGRATANADVLLLPGTEDRDIWHWFATNAMPTQARADAVLSALAEADRPLSLAALEARVDIKRGALELLLKVLAVDGAARNVPGGWVGTGCPWVYDEDRYRRIAEARVAEQQAMVAYQNTTECRMQFLTAALDDPHSGPCGRCDVCSTQWYPTQIDTPRVAQAAAELDRVGVPIPVRAQWPSGLASLLGRCAPSGKIAPGERLAEGRVVARLTDLGWGGQLRELFRSDAEGNPIDAEVPPGLARAVVRVLAGWDWPERPVAVSFVPSMSRPRLVESLASGVANLGRLELLEPLKLTPDAARLRGSTNSAYRIADVWHRFEVGPSLASRLASLAGPILLIDDLVDSRWTLTIAGRALRLAGAPSIYPLALAAVG